MSSKETIDVLLAAKALLERDLRLGLVKEEELRFVITKRKEIAVKLAAEGFSTREIAKITGADHSTIVRDLKKAAGADAPKSGANAPPSIEIIAKPEPPRVPVEPLPFRDHAQSRNSQSLLCRSVALGRST